MIGFLEYARPDVYAAALTAAAILIIGAALTVRALLTPRVDAGTLTRPAGGEDPADPPRNVLDSPLPDPTPPRPLRRLIYREDRLACGCTYIYDLEAAVMIRDTCAVCAFDPDAWNQRLTQ